MSKFQREDRYIVIKMKDLNEACRTNIDWLDLNRFNAVVNAVRTHREKGGKPQLECVVVESDWPEYEPVWKMIEDRMNGGHEHSLLEHEREFIVEVTEKRWAERLDFLHTEYGADCSGVDSGDLLDCVESEVRQVINGIEESRDEYRNLAARLAAALWDCHDSCPECGNHRINGHLGNCNQIYEKKFKHPDDYMRVFDEAFGLIDTTRH